MRKRSVQLIAKKKKVFLFIGILSFLCLLGAIVFLLFYDYYPVESRVDNVIENTKNDLKGSETIGWIRVQGTNIDFPVLYLNRSEFEGTTENYAWNSVNTETLLNKVTLSGHNIMNLSSNPKVADPKSIRFEQLMGFVYLNFVEENKYIQYTFNGEDYVYKIYAVSFPEAKDTELYVEDNLSKKEMKEYINQTLEDSIFKFDIDVNEDDKLLSLITCTRMFGAYSTRELRVDARLVRDGEIKTNYDVEKTDKYEEIEELMKGGENNDKA